MTEWAVVVVLGLIEGVTEFLPISSTGHLLLAEQWLPVRESDAFLIVIQGGAAVAVLLAFRQRVRDLFLRWRERAAQDYLWKLATAFVLTAIGGLALKSLGFMLPETAAPVAAATLAGGMLFVMVERWLRGRVLADPITWRVAIAMGLAQLVAAVFPGTSRSGATILVALAMGLSRPMAVEFSFLLGVPTLLAAAALKTMEYLHHPGGRHLAWDMLALGTFVSAVTAFAAVRWLLRYVQSHTFEGFGWYRIVLGSGVLLAGLLR